jgi:hypothetical protein
VRKLQCCGQRREIVDRLSGRQCISDANSGSLTCQTSHYPFSGSLGSRDDAAHALGVYGQFLVANEQAHQVRSRLQGRWARLPSTQLGCGMVNCSGETLWVCRHSPAENITEPETSRSSAYLHMQKPTSVRRPWPRGAMSSMPNRSNLRFYSQQFARCLLSPNRCFADEVIAATHYVGSWHCAAVHRSAAIQPLSRIELTFSKEVVRCRRLAQKSPAEAGLDCYSENGPGRHRFGFCLELGAGRSTGGLFRGFNA